MNKETGKEKVNQDSSHREFIKATALKKFNSRQFRTRGIGSVLAKEVPRRQGRSTFDTNIVFYTTHQLHNREKTQ